MPDLRGKDYFTQEEAAHYACRKVDNFREFVMKCGIPKARINGKLMYRRSDIQRVIEQEWQKSDGAAPKKIRHI